MRDPGRSKARPARRVIGQTHKIRGEAQDESQDESETDPATKPETESGAGACPDCVADDVSRRFAALLADHAQRHVGQA